MFKPFALATFDGFEPEAGFGPLPRPATYFRSDLADVRRPTNIFVLHRRPAVGEFRTHPTVSPLIAHSRSRFRANSDLTDQIERSLEAQRTDLHQLPEGWDGFGSPALVGEDIEAFFSELRLVLRGLNVFPPDVIPGGDGSLQAEWRTVNLEVEYRQEPDGGRYLWVRERDSGREHEYFGPDASLALTKWSPRLG